MKKARTNKKKTQVNKTYVFRIMNFFIGNSIKYYYKVKYYFNKPDQTVDGLQPVSLQQQRIIGRAYMLLRMQGKSKRETRKIIEKKLGIKMIPSKPNGK